MKNMLCIILCNLIVVALVILTSCENHVETTTIVPAPVYMEQEEGVFSIGDDTCISIEDESQRAVAEWFAGMFEVPAGFVPKVCSDCRKAEIRFLSDSSMKPEAYRIDVSNEKIDIHASGLNGFFYALQTIRQVLPAEIESDSFSPDVRWEVPLMTVYDEPRFWYRGLMVDVSRYFLPKENLLEIIDCMAMLKLNNLHLHLTDDNGWRVEIKKYPRLTSVGAWRVDRGDVPFPDRHNPSPGEPTPVGGFYTQDDIREIVQYAAVRQINVIPEIDLPAHSNAALAAYPQYACPSVDRYIGVLPGLGGLNADIIYCAGNDQTLIFLQDIIDEICELFPSKYIHLGGDEVGKTYWKSCYRCQDRIVEEGLADEVALQGWLMAQMAQYLKSKGRVMAGWDEVTDSEIPEDAVVFGWRNGGENVLKAADRGHSFVLTPSDRLYLVRYQGPQWFEPLAYFGNNRLKDIYEYEPVCPTWPNEYLSQLLGIQGSMWTEFCDTPDDVTYQIFPRLAAVAEVAWSFPEYKDWGRFLKGVDSYCCRLDQKGIVYSKSMYNIQHQVSSLGDGRLAVDLRCERPDVTIRYTRNGTEPDLSSEVYSSPIIIDGPVVLKAATFFKVDSSRAGECLALSLGWNKATGRKVFAGNASAGVLVNGVRGSLKQTDSEWCHYYDDATVVVDLGKPMDVDEIVIGSLTNYGMAFHKPSAISVSVSTDGQMYMPMGSKGWKLAEIFCEGRFREDIRFSFMAQPVRYVKIKATHPGDCPAGHIREGQPSRFCFDEIIVKGKQKSSRGFKPGSGKESPSVREKISDQYNKELLRWSAWGDI